MALVLLLPDRKRQRGASPAQLVRRAEDPT
jgi:hypothetical protein